MKLKCIAIITISMKSVSCRAYFYFNLVRQYGDVPFTDHVLSTTEVNTLTRKPAQEVFDWIIKECDEIKDLIIPDYNNLGALVPSGESAETGQCQQAYCTGIESAYGSVCCKSVIQFSSGRESRVQGVVVSRSQGQ